MAKRQSYKEELPKGQGMDLDPRSVWENKNDKRNKLNQDKEERRLDKSNLDHFYSDRHGLGSPIKADDYSEDSFL